MAITVADIDFLKSATGSSDGGAESATELVSGTANDLWPNISDALRTSGGSRIKKFFIKNQSATETMVSPTVWIAESPPGVTVEIGLGANSTDDATNTQGNMTAWTSNAVVSLTSSGADTRTATVSGLDTGGLPLVEVVTLTGTTEKLSTATFSKVYGIKMSAVSGSNTVTVKQGAGGTTRGTIGIGLLTCWLWFTAASKAAGLKNVSLTPGSAIPVWCRQTWSAGVSAVRPTRQVVAVEETA